MNNTVDEALLTIKEKEYFNVGDIMQILQIIFESKKEKTIFETEYIYYLKKVPEDDYYEMSNYLYSNKIDSSIIVKLYSQKIIETINKSDYSSMCKNYLVKEYQNTDEEHYNYLASSINSSLLTEYYDKDKYNNIKKKIDKFISFYKKINYVEPYITPWGIDNTDW
jgi:hypothetical protein